MNGMPSENVDVLDRRLAAVEARLDQLEQPVPEPVREPASRELFLAQPEEDEDARS